MSKVFFNNVPNIGDLFIDRVLLDYELEPVIFVCKDSYSNFFLCICDDFIDVKRSWIAIKIPVEDLLDVINDKSTLLSAFKKSKNKTIIIDYCPDKKTYDYCMMDFSDIDEAELPCKDQYLDEKETFDDYIDYLKSYFISYDIQYNSDYLDTISINFNINNHEVIVKDYNPVQDTETLEKPNEVNTKSNNKLLIAA